MTSEATATQGDILTLFVGLCCVIALMTVFTWLEIGYAKEEIKRLLREKK
jgi:flagellar biogenesis protein FliO